VEKLRFGPLFGGVEIHSKNSIINVGPSVLIADAVAETWRLLAVSHAGADALLTVEKQLYAEIPPAARYQTDAQGNPRNNVFGQPMHTMAYATTYHERLHHMVEHRLRLAFRSTANYWYPARVQAGQPDLSALDAPGTTRGNERQPRRAGAAIAAKRALGGPTYYPGVLTRNLNRLLPKVNRTAKRSFAPTFAAASIWPGG